MGDKKSRSEEAVVGQSPFPCPPHSPLESHYHGHYQAPDSFYTALSPVAFFLSTTPSGPRFPTGFGVFILTGHEDLGAAPYP